MRRSLGCLTALFVLITASAAQEPAPKLIVKPEAFETLVNPNCSHCIDEAKRRAKDLRDDDRVLCWTRGKYDGGAIPFRFFLNPYRVISDTYGTFVYDPDAGYARAFKPSLDFRFHGWRHGVMVMRHKDGTLFSCLSGVAFDGPRKGERLVPWPTVVADWGWYVTNYPGGVAYHMYEKYQPVELPAKPHADSLSSRGAPDPRLPADEIILGVDRPTGRAYPRAYRISDLEKLGPFGVLNDRFECGSAAVILWQASTRTAAAYSPTAEKRKETNKLGEQGDLIEIKEVQIQADGKSEALPFVDAKTGSRFDVVGRCREGALKGFTLAPLDSVMVKWFAWAVEYRDTTIHAQAKEGPKTGESPAPAVAKKTSDAIKEVAGSAEFLRAIPKHFATLQAVDAQKRLVTLLIEGEKLAKAWPLTPDAEVKRMGWWGRLDQFQTGERVWVWFTTDRQKRPAAVFMLCDEVSEQDIHGGGATVKGVSKESLSYVSGKQPAREVKGPVGKSLEALKADDRMFVQSAGDRALLIIDSAAFEAERARQGQWLRERWAKEGLPGSIAFVHIYSGEAELMLDHEAMRWGRSLKAGDKVIVNTASPINAVVKSVSPWRERTQVRLVINGLDIAELAAGQRVLLKMPTPPAEVDSSPYPPDIDKERTREERIEWFLANIYCTCPVGGDICTGDFYTLASCNPNGCGAPNATRKKIAEKIDQGLSNRQILDDLRAERGPRLLKPHLLP
jgi:Protein of unknown function (DUF3179)